MKNKELVNLIKRNIGLTHKDMLLLNVELYYTMEKLDEQEYTELKILIDPPQPEVVEITE